MRETYFFLTIPTYDIKCDFFFHLQDKESGVCLTETRAGRSRDGGSRKSPIREVAEAPADRGY